AHRAAPSLAPRAGIEASLPFHQPARKSRSRLVEALKRWEIGRARTVPLERGEVTAGGVALDEVNPATMASRKAEGLYLCGEVLDIAGPVGGYKLEGGFFNGLVAGDADG